MRRLIYASTAFLLSWLLAAGSALSQDVPLVAVHAAPAPAAIALAPGYTYPLDLRSRYWLDGTGARTIDQVEAASDNLPWAVRQPGASYDVEGSALWFQFDAVSDGTHRWFLQVGSSGIDRVQMFYRGANGRWVEQEAGDTKAVSHWPLPGRFPTFELSTETGKPVRYWVRIEHARVDFASAIVIHAQGNLLAEREREQFLLGAYFGLAALIAFVALANAIGYRDRNFAIYAIYVIALAAGQLAYLGVGAQHVWDEWLKWNEISTFLLPGISAAAALWFCRTVTEPARYSRALDLTVWAVIAALLSAMAMDTVLQTRGSFKLALALMSIALVVVVILIAVVWTKGEDPYIRWIALGFLPVLVMAVFPVARGLNLIPNSILTRYGLSIGAALEMPILFYALSLRGARRREADVRTSALAHNDPLTGLAHNRTLLQRLDSAIVRARNLRHPCALLVVRISNYNAIVAEFGRDTADRAMVVAASLLRRAITDVDLAARVGDHDFALLLEGPTTTENATGRAQQIVASGLRSSDALPQGLVLKFHIAVAMLPDRDLDAAGSLDWVVEGVSSMSPESRKLIRPLNF
ncbi:MAG: 7TM diverse intracellular signaling domain-containing protein [Ramlibacter sp.]|nr:7TM diverse intracellular signaling domain-containing protein [Ramlibacter sp.]